MKKYILAVMMATSLLAEVDLIKSEDENANGIFIRTGVGFSIGASKVRREETIIATEDVTKKLLTPSVIGNAVDLTLGYENYDRKVRFFFNIKLPYENIDEYELKSTRSMGGIEGFSDLGAVNVNYGLMIGGGKAIFTNKIDSSPSSELVGFLAAEPYIGVDGALKGGFGYYFKLGYEVKGFDTAMTDNETTTTRDDIVIYAINFGAGLSYKF